MLKICFYALLGAIIGGIFAPLALMLFCAVVLRDTGGPLIWPLIAILLGFTGLAVGAWQGGLKDDV